MWHGALRRSVTIVRAMIDRVLEDHPQRISLTNELHARPFQPVAAPGRLLHLAITPVDGAAERSAAADRAHLTALLDRFGASYPAPEADHHTVDLGRFRLKWERHTEFVSYTLYEDGPGDDVFEAKLLEQLPESWLAMAPGSLIAAVEVEVFWADDADAADGLLQSRLVREFTAESLAVARVLDGEALAMGDFRIHEGGFTRFGIIHFGGMGTRRIGRISQRLIEIEVYRALAMLALPVARHTARRLNEIERELAGLIGKVASEERDIEENVILAALTAISAEIEALAASSAFRFGASGAYEAIVHERIRSLSEDRVGGRQLFREFMMRRFDPAMRTVHSVERRLSELSSRASRVAELLRTRVNVAVEAQNQRLLASMDRRAAMQLRLQETVEGLSAVAISYYAVSLLGPMLAPFTDPIGIDKTMVTAAITLPVVLIVYGLIRRMRRRLAARTAGSER